MDKKATLVVAWFATSFITLLFSLTLLIFLSISHEIEPAVSHLKLYTALPENISEVTDDILSADARAKIVENFFKGYNSVLAGYSNSFVRVADQYNLDFRLLPAIAMQESNGGKKVIKGSYNPFGYGIYGNSVIRFASWEEAIEKVGKQLKEDYIDKGLTTPEKIMTKYTPPSISKGGPWAYGVKSFMNQLR